MRATDTSNYQNAFRDVLRFSAHTSCSSRSTPSFYKRTFRYRRQHDEQCLHGRLRSILRGAKPGGATEFRILNLSICSSSSWANGVIECSHVSSLSAWCGGHHAGPTVPLLDVAGLFVDSPVVELLSRRIVNSLYPAPLRSHLLSLLCVLAAGL